MSNNPKISVIIPVYGVEKYIAKCIESIKVQTFTDFEVFLINDGTKDNSVAVAEDAIAGDERFIILHKKNGGQGSARNLGLDNARGDYIAFIDSDVWVEPRYLQAMYEKITEEDADVCICAPIIAAYLLANKLEQTHIRRLVLVAFLCFVRLTFFKSSFGKATDYSDPKYVPYQTIFEVSR